MDWRRESFYASSYLLLLLFLIGCLLSFLLLRANSHHKKNRITLSAFREDKLRQKEISAVTIHELRSPLAAISLYAQIIAKTDKRAKKILAQVELMNGLITRLMNFTKITDKTFPLQYEDFCLKRLLREIVNVKQQLNPQYTYVLHVPKEKCVVHADKNCVTQVITNLLSNARKYSPEQTKITTDLSQTNITAIVAITDQGAGIPKDIEPFLFQPFSQGKNKKNGLGLGLFISKGIMDLHKGTITYKTAAGGTTFTITLPKK